MSSLIFIFCILFGFVFSQNNDTELCFIKNCGSFVTQTPAKVKIGSYINQIAALNVPESHVRFDLYMWIKWPICLTDDNGSPFRPDLSLQIENGIQKIDIVKVPTFPEPICVTLPSGEMIAYYEWRIEGQFRQFFDYHRYPLDSHTVEIKIEDNFYSDKYLVYEKDDFMIGDEGASGMSEHVRLSGWEVRNFTEYGSKSNYYTSNFALIYGVSVYSRYTFGVEISRGVAIYLLKILPPILIVLCITGMILLLDVEAMDTRIATAVGALLTSVFLQLTFSGDLPTVDYMTLMDWIFNWTYFLILMIIIECIAMRKYYRVLTHEGQSLKDEVVLHSLDPDKGNKDWMSEKVMHLKEKKQMVKNRIRQIERILFAVYYLVVFLILLIASLAGRFG